MTPDCEILVGYQFNKSKKCRRIAERIERGIHRWKFICVEPIFSAENHFAICFDCASESFVAVRMINIRARENYIKHNRPGSISRQPFHQSSVNSAIPWPIVRLLQYTVRIFVHIDHDDFVGLNDWSVEEGKVVTQLNQFRADLKMGFQQHDA